MKGICSTVARRRHVHRTENNNNKVCLMRSPVSVCVSLSIYFARIRTQIQNLRLRTFPWHTQRRRRWWWCSMKAPHAQTKTITFRVKFLRLKNEIWRMCRIPRWYRRRKQRDEFHVIVTALTNFAVNSNIESLQDTMFSVNLLIVPLAASSSSTVARRSPLRTFGFTFNLYDEIKSYNGCPLPSTANNPEMCLKF